MDFRLIRNILAVLLIVLIICSGIFKIQILSVLETFANENLDMIKPAVMSLGEGYDTKKNVNEWIAHYGIFYPIYLSFHFILIYVLFYNQLYLRRILMMALFLLLTVLVMGKVIFGYFNATVMAEYFSFAFHKLVALPFILLAIEGGRQIWQIVEKADIDNN